MIPNAGLDNIAAYRPWGSATNVGLSGNAPDASGTQWLAYAAISEDSSTPGPSDTNIGSEAMRTNATGGFNRTSTAIRDPVTNRLGLSIERAYVFTIASNLNITKYGYVPLDVGGNFSWIDLTREDPNDPGSTPVTLTLVPGDELQLWQTFTITVPWSVDLESFTITGTDGNDNAGTHDAYCGFYAANDTLTAAGSESSIALLISTVFWPHFSIGGENRSLVWTSQATPNAAREAAVGPNTSYGVGELSVLSDYTQGTYYRDKLFTLTTSQGNAKLTAVVITAAGGTLRRPDSAHGFKVVFDDPSTFDKDNLHTLTLTFRVSWAEG